MYKKNHFTGGELSGNSSANHFKDYEWSCQCTFRIANEVLVAAAGLNYHVAILFKNDIRVVIEVKNRNGGKFDGRTARFRDAIRIH